MLAYVLRDFTGHEEGRSKSNLSVFELEESKAANWLACCFFLAAKVARARATRFKRGFNGS